MNVEAEHQVRDLLPGYALGILADEETRLVDEHLAGCDVCRVELRQLQMVAGELPLALAQTDPSPVVKTRLMGAIHARGERFALPSQPTFWQKVMGFFRTSAPAWALVVIGVLVIVNLSLWRRLNQSTADTPAMRVIALASTKAAPNAIGTLVLDQQGTYGTLVVDKMQVLHPDQQYQVWMIQDGVRTSAGLFSVNYDGYASLELMVDQPLIQYDAIGITIEPAGGSPGPTGDKVLGGELSN